MGQDVDAARKTFGTVPPGRPLDAEMKSEAGGSGPHAPGPVDPIPEAAPESGGYDTRPPVRQPDNRKGGYGAG